MMPSFSQKGEKKRNRHLFGNKYKIKYNNLNIYKIMGKRNVDIKIIFLLIILNSYVRNYYQLTYIIDIFLKIFYIYIEIYRIIKKIIEILFRYIDLNLNN